MRRTLLPLLAAALSLSIGATAATAPPASPTTATSKTVTPEDADRVWREASKPFDAERRKLLDEVDAGAANGPFRPDWASLQQYRSPAWYDDAKFGIFIHWSIFSVPAFGNEWYSRNMYVPGSPEFAHHVATYGSQAKFGYKDFIPMFKAERFDPDAWAALFREAGARYVVGVAEHSDGFAMYDSQLSRWTAVKMGPHRDLMAALGKAVHGAGLRFGLSTHRAEHDWFFDRGRDFDSDVNDPQYADFYGPAQPHMPMKGDDGNQSLASDWTYVSTAWVDDWLARVSELEKYHPDMIYADWWIGHPAFRTAIPRLLAYYYNAGSRRGGVVLNYKLNALMEGTGTRDVERGQLDAISPTHWQTDTTISENSWCYVKDAKFRSATPLIHVLADTVSKNGNLLLDIGPRPDGTIVEEEQAVLRDIGGWLHTNGAAIYGSHPWRTFGEGPTHFVPGAFQEKTARPYTPADFRFTTHDGRLYAIELGWPEGGKTTIHALTATDGVRSVKLLGSGQAVQWKQTVDGLSLTAPARPPGLDAYVYEIELAQGTKP